jgi:hypothetical protein
MFVIPAGFVGPAVMHPDSFARQIVSFFEDAGALRRRLQLF